MAGRSYASPDWSDLPIDVLIHVLRLLDIPQALAFRAVCPSWRSASTAACGAPRTRRTPWLVSLTAEPLPGGQGRPRLRDSITASSKFRSLLDEKTFQVSFPRGKTVALCGATHGWLVVASGLSDLLLYDPFTTSLVPLPPITSKRGMHLYDKIVLSGSPSAGAAIAFLVQEDGKLLSFVRVGNSYWSRVSTIGRGDDESFADCVHHSGRFYALTMKGILMSWDFGGSDNPKSEEIVANCDSNIFDVITRYLVSTPWGHLLQVSVILDMHLENGVRVEIDMLDLENGRRVRLAPAKALRGHTVFLGQNSPGILSTNEFPELRPDCIYFTTPRLRNKKTFWRIRNEWCGVKIYDLKRRTLEHAFFPSGGGNYGTLRPSEVCWFTPTL